MQVAEDKHPDPTTGEYRWHLVGGQAMWGDPVSACMPQRILKRTTLHEPEDTPPGATKCGMPACQVAWP